MHQQERTGLCIAHVAASRAWWLGVKAAIAPLAIPAHGDSMQPFTCGV